MGTNAGCGSRTSCPLDGGCSSIFLVFIRRRNPPTGAPTVVLATRWCAERREGADDASARLAAVFRLSGSRNPAAAGRAPPLRFGARANRSLRARASATAQTPFFTLEFLPGCPSRSWRRQAREFDVKGLSFRLKGQPLASAMAELVGKDVFTFAGKWHNQ